MHHFISLHWHFLKPRKRITIECRALHYVHISTGVLVHYSVLRRPMKMINIHYTFTADQALHYTLYTQPQLSLTTALWCITRFTDEKIDLESSMNLTKFVYLIDGRTRIWTQAVKTPNHVCVLFWSRSLLFPLIFLWNIDWILSSFDIAC